MVDPLSDVLSGLSLAAVIVIGWWSIRLGARSAAAAEKSAQASVDAAEASVKAAEATERSVTASEHAAFLASQDATTRRLEAVLDVVLEMRELFNEEMAAHENEVPPWVPPRHSPEELGRTALCRKLAARLVPFESEAVELRNPQSISVTHNWTSSSLESSIDEVKALLHSSVDPQG
jgi:hypothetical protein